MGLSLSDVTRKPEAPLSLSHPTQLSLKNKGNRGDGTELPQHGEGRGLRPPAKLCLGETLWKLWLFPLLYVRRQCLPTHLSLISAALGPSTPTVLWGALQNPQPGPSIQGPLAKGTLSQDHDLLRKVLPSAPGQYCLFDSPSHLTLQ